MIVLIEDNKVFSENLIKKLNKKGINEIHLFESIKSYIHIKADLYIIDIRLEKNSFELMEEIRKKTWKLIVAFSHYTSQEYIIKALDHGADLYVEKHDSPTLTVKKIRKLLEISKLLPHENNR